MAARVLLCLVDEYTGGRRWCNRSQLAKSLGVGKMTLYKYLDEMFKAQWITYTGRADSCVRHGGAR